MVKKTNQSRTPVQPVLPGVARLVDAYFAGVEGVQTAKVSQLAGLKVALEGVGKVTEGLWDKDWKDAVTKAVEKRGLTGASLKVTVSVLKIATLALTSGNSKFLPREGETLQPYVQRLREELKAAGVYKGNARVKGPSAGNSAGGAARTSKGVQMTFEGACLKVAGNEALALLVKEVFSSDDLKVQFRKWAKAQLDD